MDAKNNDASVIFSGKLKQPNGNLRGKRGI
jgi:hypothetical protein